MEAFRKLEDVLIEAVTIMRDRVCDLEDPPSYFDFNVEVSGRSMDGELEVVFKFNSGSYDKQTKGGDLTKTFEEYIRRYDWGKRNAPLCLPKVPNAEEEIPF
jgi:hypothetical protein